jgi:hypothetical protein
MKKIKITKEQYNRITSLLTEADTGYAKGGLTRVDKMFKKVFAGKDHSTIKKVSEEMRTKSFDIEKASTGVSKSGQPKFGKELSENTEKLKNETIELIKYLYRKSEDFSPFWAEHDLTYDDICDTLLDKGVLIKKDGKFELSKSLGTPEEAKQAVEDELRKMVGNEVANIEEGDWFDSHPDHPANQPEPRYSKASITPSKLEFEGLYSNGEIAILKDKSGALFSFYYDNIPVKELDSVAHDLGFAEEEYIGKDEDGMPEFDYYYDWRGDEHQEPMVLAAYASENNLETGEGLEDWENGVELVKIDEPLRNELLSVYDKDKKLTNILGSLNEIESDEDRMARLRAAIEKKRADSKKWEDEYFKQRDIQNAIDSARAEEKLRQQNEPQPEQPIEPKKPIGQHNMFGGIDEMGTAGAMGGGTTTGSVFGSPSNAPVGKFGEPIKKTFKESMESSSETIGQYATPAFKMKKNHTDFAETKPKAFKKTQWAGGSFVDFDDCVKPNNNKKAQQGGCSTGAVDNVVKLKKTKGNINAPSLNESMMREALKLQHDKKENKLIVISDLEGRAASQETFTNKAVLKQNGFVWTGTNWAIPADKLDVAKKTLSLINKAEYLIDKLEDLESAVEEANADNKSLLKARLDQYIADLANATDEAALSAEIRRYLTFFSKFHSYSFYNRMLIFIQRPDATKVASYKTWQSKFRQVNKGAKAITVLAPIISKSNKADGEEDELTSTSDVKGFRAVNVFDISDTSPIDERGNVPEEPQWWGENTPSETADMLYDAVVEVATDLGIKVTQSDAKGGEKGFSAGDHINISSDVSGAGRLSTMIHEIAHELMHWKKSSIYYIDNGQGKESYALGELQAESVSYVVLKHYGIPVSHHATYLALWKANKEKIQNNLEIISKVAQFIIDKIDKQVAQGK